MKLFLTLAGLLYLLLLTPANAQTRANCAPRDRIVERLNETYGETRQAVGLAGNNTMMELFASDSTGSWTITATLPSGLTCLVASGQSFEAVKDPLLPTGLPI